MNCKYCGQMIDDNVAFCPHCGKSTKEAPAAGAHGYESAPSPAYTPTQAPAQEQKSKLAAGLLGIFLGWLGVHNFYLGYTKKAVAQVLLGTLGSCLVVGPFISSVWGLVEGIMILCGSINVDGKGVPLKD